MKVKERWTDDDYNEMDWHDSKLYQLKFLDEKFEITLFLDYIFEWIKENEGFKFLVSPCKLIFKNVSNLNIKLAFENHIGIYINEIRRSQLGLTPNKKFINWKYIIETDRGNIEFNTTGYKMELISDPIITDRQDLSDSADLQSVK